MCILHIYIYLYTLYIYIYKARLIYFMYIYIHVHICVYVYIYIHYTICNLLIMNYDLMISGQDLAGSLPLCQHRHHWCFDVLPTAQIAAESLKILSDSDSDGIWGPNVMREFPRNYIVLGIFTLGDARCENYTAVIFAETACVEWIWKIRSWRFTIHGWGSCTRWHCLLAVYGAQPGQMDTHGEFLWARLPLCLCPWKDHPSTTAEDSEVLI